MKIARIALPLVLALVASLAVTGCKHKQTPQNHHASGSSGADGRFQWESGEFWREAI